MGMFDNAKVIVLFAATLNHALQGKFRLGAVCICGHEGPIDPAPLAARHNPHTRLTWLAKRLRCTACRGRGEAWVTLKRYNLDGTPYGADEERLAQRQARGGLTP